jgi:hypothetical protein
MWVLWRGEAMPAWRVLVLLAVISATLLLGVWASEVRAQGEGEGGDGRGGSGNGTLRITGDPEARFSGACVIGGEERDIGGQVPQRYDLNGRKLACEIRKTGAESGELKVVLSDENTRFVQWIEGGKTVVKLSYENGNVSSSTVSSSGGQTSSSSSQVLISSSSQTMSSGFFSPEDITRGNEGQSLADRIIRKVNNDIAERFEP